jgi:hypothetical protein
MHVLTAGLFAVLIAMLGLFVLLFPILVLILGLGGKLGGLLIDPVAQLIRMAVIIEPLAFPRGFRSRI